MIIRIVVRADPGMVLGIPPPIHEALRPIYHNLIGIWAYRV